LAILKIQVHRDRSKELADNRRFTLAANIEAYSATRKQPAAARVEILRKVHLLAQSDHSTSETNQFEA
jgi:hypothetical protein